MKRRVWCIYICIVDRAAEDGDSDLSTERHSESALIIKHVWFWSFIISRIFGYA